MSDRVLHCESSRFSGVHSLAVLGLALGACAGARAGDDGARADVRVGGELDGAGGGGAAGTGGGAAGTGAGGTGHAGAGGTEGTDSGSSEDAGANPCSVTDTAAMCTSRPVLTIVSGADARRIYWNEPPRQGGPSPFPLVILFQGSFFGPSGTWGVSLPKATTPFGGYYQVVLVAKLLEIGFIVVQPEAQGGLFWNTNNGSDYDTSPDSVFIPRLLAEIEKGTFGRADATRLYATGISSGGYMTSRMAVSYAGRFRALAIEPGSYASCLGPLCVVPSVLPADHPPTLFLHGGADTTVPIATAQDYYRKLQAQGIEAKFVEAPAASHQWLDTAPEDVTNWFLAH